MKLSIFHILVHLKMEIYPGLGNIKTIYLNIATLKKQLFEKELIFLRMFIITYLFHYLTQKHVNLST